MLRPCQVAALSEAYTCKIHKSSRPPSVAILNYTLQIQFGKQLLFLYSVLHRKTALLFLYSALHRKTAHELTQMWQAFQYRGKSQAYFCSAKRGSLSVLKQGMGNYEAQITCSATPQTTL